MVRKNCYALRVRGHSMIEDHSQDGDIIVVEKRETAENGESVVAMINGERVTLKKFYVEAEGILLQRGFSPPPYCSILHSYFASNAQPLLSVSIVAI